MEKTYTNGEITVVWRPDLCTHSTKCWRGLVSVFNPKNRPWIDMQGADTATIAAQVEQCPSQALSYYRNTDGPAPTTAEAETATTTVIEALTNGPLLVYGTLTVKNADGETVLENKTTAFCRCGHSQNKPYCDGAHVKAKFQAP